MDEQTKQAALKAIKTQVLSLFGGPKVVSEICGISESAISQWRGVPLIHQMKLYAHAQATGMEFDAEVFHVVPKKVLNRVAGVNHSSLKRQDGNSQNGIKVL